MSWIVNFVGVKQRQSLCAITMPLKEDPFVAVVQNCCTRNVDSLVSSMCILCKNSVLHVEVPLEESTNPVSSSSSQILWIELKPVKS